MNFIQFVDSKGQDILGSDGILTLDGRLCFQSAVDNAHVQAWRLRPVKPQIAGFQVRQGHIGSSRLVNSTNYFPPSGPDGTRKFH